MFLPKTPGTLKLVHFDCQRYWLNDSRKVPKIGFPIHLRNFLNNCTNNPVQNSTQTSNILVGFWRLRPGNTFVTIDKSLKAGSRLSRSRNVLKRSERIARLQFEDRWVEGQSPFGLPKVRVIKTVVGKKKKKKKKEDEDDDDNK